MKKYIPLILHCSLLFAADTGNSLGSDNELHRKYYYILGNGASHTFDRVVSAEENGAIYLRKLVSEGKAQGTMPANFHYKKSSPALLPKTLEIVHVEVQDNPLATHRFGSDKDLPLLKADDFAARFAAAYTLLIEKGKPITTSTLQWAECIDIECPKKHAYPDPELPYTFLTLCIGLTEKNKRDKHNCWLVMDRLNNGPHIWRDLVEANPGRFKQVTIQDVRILFGSDGDQEWDVRRTTVNLWHSIFKHIAELNGISIADIEFSPPSNSDTTSTESDEESYTDSESGSCSTDSGEE